MFLDVFAYDKIPLMLAKALDYTSKANDVITSNIANSETPGYKRKEVSFQSVLNSYIDDLDMVDSKADVSINGDYEPDIYEVTTGKTKRDGNNVDMDSEMVKMAENQLKFYSAIQLFSKKHDMLIYAIREGR
jgi:flagellar basal-body rod protein FlgB